MRVAAQDGVHALASRTPTVYRARRAMSTDAHLFVATFGELCQKCAGWLPPKSAPRRVHATNPFTREALASVDFSNGGADRPDDSTAETDPDLRSLGVTTIPRLASADFEVALLALVKPDASEEERLSACAVALLGPDGYEGNEIYVLDGAIVDALNALAEVPAAAGECARVAGSQGRREYWLHALPALVDICRSAKQGESVYLYFS